MSYLLLHSALFGVLEIGLSPVLGRWLGGEGMEEGLFGGEGGGGPCTLTLRSCS